MSTQLKINKKTKYSECKNVKKYLKLLDTFKNNIEISNKNLKDKYTNFEDSKLDESRTLLFEIDKPLKNYKRYFRGEIVRVKFGVNIGSEFSGDHFAIVVSKGDTMMNSTLHVIPITSKMHKKSLNIGTILYDDNKLNILRQLLETEKNSKKKNKIKRVIKYYEKRKNIVSYACIDHIKTVSKLSVDKTLFSEFDYLPELKCSDYLMNIIDKSILKEFTLINIT